MAEISKALKRAYGNRTRSIRLDGDCAYVHLTKSRIAVIDIEDLSLIDGHNWYAKIQGNTAYAVRKDHSRDRSFNIPMHRIIVNAPCEFLVDHIDGNGLNNRRSNLRLATVAQNQHNKKLQKNNKSGFKGVSFRQDRNNWVARIGINSKYICLGSFDTPELAHLAYCKASMRLHGEFGRRS
jgi:hypothetical protein